MNIGLGRTAYWLSVSLPSQPNFELVLQDPSQWMDSEALAQAVPGMAAQPQIILSTDDIEGLQAWLRAAGVPMPCGNIGNLPWGRDLALRDPSGSGLYVVQPAVPAQLGSASGISRSSPVTASSLPSPAG